MSNIGLRLKAIRESGRRKLFLIPYFFTFANVLFGFLSGISSLEDHYVIASYCIIIAAFMDFIDGKLARAFKTTSYLGMELDSLGDAISFCFAPTILLYSWYFNEFGLLGILVLVLYLCAGLFRLARFNVAEGGNYSYFTGLPTTVSACILASLVICSHWFILMPLRMVLQPLGIILFVYVISLLMVSRIPFPSFKNQ